MYVFFFLLNVSFICTAPSQRIGTRTLRPRCTSHLKGVNPTGAPGYRNGTDSFFGLKRGPSVVRDVQIHYQPVLRMRRK